MSVTNFAKKQFKKIELLTGGARKTAVLAGNDVLSGGYSFKKFISDAKNVEHSIPAPVKQAIMDGALAAVAGKRPKKTKELKPKQGRLVKGSIEAKEHMKHLRSLRKK